MRELPVEFEGRGAMKGFSFRQIAANNYAYIYEKSYPDIPYVSYEVFQRKEGKTLDGNEDIIMYPREKAFGVWAKDCNNLDRAKYWFEEYTRRGIEKFQNQSPVSRIIDDLATS